MPSDLEKSQAVIIEKLREALEAAAEEICLSKCSEQQANHEHVKDLMELAMPENDLHLKNHGFINEALSLDTSKAAAVVNKLRVEAYNEGYNEGYSACMENHNMDAASNMLEACRKSNDGDAK